MVYSEVGFSHRAQYYHCDSVTSDIILTMNKSNFPQVKRSLYIQKMLVKTSPCIQKKLVKMSSCIQKSCSKRPEFITGKNWEKRDKF